MADEYICKADAIKQCGFGMTSLHIADNLRAMQPADVVPVVRCDDCKYYDSRRWCGLHSSVFDDNAFCSYGERKGE